MSALLTFDQFDAAIPSLIAEADAQREQLWRIARRDHDDGVAGTIAAAIREVAHLVPFIQDIQNTPGGPIYYDAGAPDHGRRTDVRKEALRACAQLLEAAAAVRDHMTPDNRRDRSEHLAQRVGARAFHIFSTPGALMPDWTLTWNHALDELADAVRFMFSARLMGQSVDIGPRAAHDALEASAGATFCVLALLDAQRRAQTD